MPGSSRIFRPERSSVGTEGGGAVVGTLVGVMSATACVFGGAEALGVAVATDLAVAAGVPEGFGVVVAGVAVDVGEGEADACVGVVVTAECGVAEGDAEDDGVGLAGCGVAVGVGVGVGGGVFVGDATALTATCGETTGGVAIRPAGAGWTGATTGAGVAAVTGEDRARPSITPAISRDANGREECDRAKRCNDVAVIRSRV